MPIYEYECRDCGQRSERLMKLSDPDPVDCEACGKPGLKRALTAPSFRLAGSGWYETDFKSDKDKKRNLAGDGAAKSDAPKADAPKAESTKVDAPKAEAPKAPAKSPAD